MFDLCIKCTKTQKTFIQCRHCRIIHLSWAISIINESEKYVRQNNDLHRNICEFKLAWWPVLSLSIVDSNEANYCPSTGNNPKNAIFAVATLSMPAASVVVMVSCRALNHSNNGDSNLHFK